MKLMNTLIKWTTCLLLTASTLVAQETIAERQQRAQQVELFYNLAVKAYEDGDIKAAREALSSALTLNRAHAHSIALARQMRANGSQTVLARRKRIFNSVMIPIIDLEEATVRDSINVLSKAVETQSKGKVIPNFIIQDRNKTFDDVKITLKLKNIPAGDVLDHLLKSAGASASFGKYTTTIRPRGNASGEKTEKDAKEEE
jgi:hypothetical protein